MFSPLTDSQGAERGVAEVVCEGFKNDSATTSGGGFSTFYDQPSYQKAHVDAYFVAAASAAHTPVAGYGKGRGYPDVSLAGYNYITRIGTKNLRSSGSVLSAPTVAGFFSSINAARLALGKGSLGWVNPALYANYTSYTNDVTKGNNRCVSPALCCAQGFYATAGWDPATGLGSLNYGKLSHVLVSNGVVNGAQYLPSTLPTAKPSSTPSAAPSTTKPSSARPSRIPTSKPTTRTPTSSPTLAIKTNILASQVCPRPFFSHLCLSFLSFCLIFIFAL